MLSWVVTFLIVALIAGILGFGGIAGASYVLAAVALARPLGVATLFAAIIVGQLTAGLVIDHFGWFNVPVHRLSPERVIGAVLLVGGMALIRWR